MQAFRYIFPVIFIAAITIQTYAQTTVSGYILTNTTWTLAGSPYIVTGNILVNNGVTLTIEPGVTVKFDTTKTLQIDGELIAIGNVQNRITFTASSASPVRGSWGRIQFSPSSTDAVFDTAGNYVSGSILKYCDIKYGGGVAGDATVYCDAAAPYFTHCRISECLKRALYVINAVSKVDSSLIANCGATALYYMNPQSADLIITNDTIENNAAGIYSNGAGNSTNLVVQNCIFTRNNTAINVSGFAKSVCQNNIFTLNGNVIQGEMAYVNISENIFVSNTRSVLGANSISCGPEPYSTFSASTVNITDNHFENNKGVIYISASKINVLNNTFRNNEFLYAQGCGWTPEHVLLKFLFWGGGKVINNVFEGNFTSSTSGKIMDFESLDWEIANNVFKNNANAAIDCYYRANICTNRFLNNSGTVIYSSGNSASVTNSIHDNEFIDNSGNRCYHYCKKRIHYS